MPDDLTVVDPDGTPIVVFRWPAMTPRAVVHIMHGWAEHAQRYNRVATRLAGAGYHVYADDHRGHGETGRRTNMLGDLGPRGMEGVLDACHAVTAHARAAHPDLPIFVLGHSWGSFLLQQSLRRWGTELDGALLTGTTYLDPSHFGGGGERDLNAPFAPARTAYDWLSRDEEEVDRYIADPLCGFEIMTTALDPRALLEGDDDAIPRRLPIFIFNGAEDPIGGEAGGRRLAEHYRTAGIHDVTFRAYPGARHELFNETNREEVTDDVLAWLDAHTEHST